MATSGLLLAVLLILTGCTSLNRDTASRSFVLRKVWVKSAPAEENTGYRKINRASPILVGDLLLSFNSMDGVVAWDREAGQEKWRLKTVNGIEGGATLFKGRIYFGANDGVFYAVDARTGRVVWSSPTRSEMLSEPLFDGDTATVYVLSSANTVHAFEADSGKPLWVYNRQESNTFAVRGGTKPALHRGTLFVGFSDGSLAALNAKSGQVLWDVQLNKNKKFKDVDTSPIVDGSRLYIAGYDDRLYCLSADNGAILWRHETGGFGGLTLQGNRLYYPTSDGHLRALDKESGQVLWSIPVRNGIASMPVLYKGLLVFGESRGDLRFVDASSGRAVASFEPGRGVFSAPFVDEKRDRVYFISNEANVYSMEARWESSSAYPWLAPSSF